MDNGIKERLEFNDFIREYNKVEEFKPKMSNLKECFEEARKASSKYIGVYIATPTLNELVIIKNNDFKNKLEYYKKAYDDNLKLKNNNNVYIKGFTHANQLNNIGYDLY